MTAPHRLFKQALYEQIARVGKAMSAPKRLELLDLLSQAPRTVEALADQAAISVANASQHLQILRATRLVESQRRGTHIEYRLAEENVEQFLLSFRALAKARLLEIEQVTRAWLEQRGALEPIDGDELLRRVRSGEVTVLDVRPAQEYVAGHIPGALSIPVDELATRLNELPSGRTVVAYCRGPYCVMALDAVAFLRRSGFEAQRMETGVVEWRSRGWPIESKSDGAAS